jgi:hypothetical protein
MADPRSPTVTFTIDLNTGDKTAVDDLLNKDGSSSDTSNTTYNLNAKEDWASGAAGNLTIVSATNGITGSGVGSLKEFHENFMRISGELHKLIHTGYSCSITACISDS